jgi:HSP20 family protein
MTLVRYQPKAVANWSPRTRSASLLGGWDSLFDQIFERLPEQDLSWTPRVDIREDEDKYYVMVDLPGMKKEDLQVTMNEGVLTIEGERKENETKEGEHVHRRERFCGRFARSMTFPTDVDKDKIKARFENGVLNLELNKHEQTKPRQISID